VPNIEFKINARMEGCEIGKIKIKSMINIAIFENSQDYFRLDHKIVNTVYNYQF